MSAGVVVNVEEVVAGSELAADALTGASSITVEDPTDFQPDGGELLIGAQEVGYSAVNEATGVITLDATLVADHFAEEQVFALPSTIERFAHVELDGQEETLQARIPHGLYDRLPVGNRDENLDEAELVEVDRAPDGELVVADVLDREPLVDGRYLDPDSTIPPAAMTDGLAPAVSPTPTVLGGVLSLFVTWLAVSNPDPVTYEVHVSTSSGFTPGVGTFAGEARGTLFVIRHLPGTTNPPAYGTTYFVKLIAKDLDGAAAASAEDSATPADGMEDAIIADLIAANAVLAEKLEAVLVLASTIVAGVPGAGRVELGIATDESMGGMVGIHAMAEDGMTLTFMVDSADGSVYLKGRLDFGRGSRLLADDIIELFRQEPNFATPVLVQIADRTSDSGTSTANLRVPTKTTTGNLLLGIVTLLDTDGTPPTPTTPSGWTLAHNITFSSGATACRHLVYKRENAPSLAAGNLPITLGDTCAGVITYFVEYAGVSVEDVKANSGDGANADPGVTGTTAATTQAAALAFATFVALNEPSSFPANGDGYTVLPHGLGVTIGANTLRTRNLAKTLAATGAQGTSQDFSAAREYAGSIIVFKAKPEGADTPDPDLVRLFARDVSSVAMPHAKLENGTEGALVLGTAGEVWREEIVSVTVNLVSIGAHAGIAQTFSHASVKAGDYVEYLGPSGLPSDAEAGRGLVFTVENPVAADGAIETTIYNAHNAAADALNKSYKFRLLHRAPA